MYLYILVEAGHSVVRFPWVISIGAALVKCTMQAFTLRLVGTGCLLIHQPPWVRVRWCLDKVKCCERRVVHCPTDGGTLEWLFLSLSISFDHGSEAEQSLHTTTSDFCRDQAACGHCSPSEAKALRVLLFPLDAACRMVGLRSLLLLQL